MDFFNNKIIDKKDIENLTKVPVLGGIGHNNTENDTPVFSNPKSSIAESFRSLRTNIQYVLPEEDTKVVLISSTISGEGKTFCATNLAAITAMSGKKTLLVGMDLRKPKIHKDFGMKNDIGISTFLISRNSFEEIIQPTHIENLSVATSGPVPPNPAELLDSSKIEDFMKQARQSFDFIVLDSPPVAIVTDPILISKHADSNIFVVRQNYTNKNLIYQLLQKESELILIF